MSRKADEDDTPMRADPCSEGQSAVCRKRLKFDEDALSTDSSFSHVEDSDHHQLSQVARL